MKSECKGSGNCIRHSETVCEECLSFYQQHSSVAGKAEAYLEISKMVAQQSKDDWFNGDIVHAERLRELWREIEERRAKLGKELDKFITASLKKPS